MKKFLIKLISMLLLVAMLLPLAVACSEEPPPQNNENEGGEGGEGEGNQTQTAATIDIKQVGTTEKVILDPATTTVTQDERILKIEEIDGIPVFRWNVQYQNIGIGFPETIEDFVGYYYLEFSVYSPTKTNATIKIQPNGARAAQPIVLDFEGWMKYRIRTEEFQAYYPTPDITGMSFYFDSGTRENLTVYISEIKLVTPKYELVVPEGIDVNDSAIYDEIVDNYRNRLVGDSSVLDIPEYQTKVSSLNNRAQTNWDSFKDTYTDNAEAGVVFGIPMDGVDPTGIDKDPVTGKVKKLGTNIKLYYEKLRYMAEGYAAKGDLHKNPELLADIKKGLEYGYKYYYGEEVLQGVCYGDWFPWQISIPGEIVNILVCIHGDIDQALIDKYLAPFHRLVNHPRGAASNMLNTARYLIGSAVLRKDAYMLAETLELIQNEYQYVDLLELDAREIRDGGFYSDGSFVQHTGTPYTYAYGIGMLHSIADIGVITVGTAFEKQNEVTEHQYEFLFNAFLTTTYDVNGMNSLAGRCVDQHRMERDSFLSVFSGAILIRSYAPERWKAKYDALVKHLLIRLDTLYHNPWIDSIPISMLDCLSLVNDDSIAPLEALNETIVFHNMDRVIQHNENYGVALSLCSTRILKYESINAANELGWYHGDGMIYIYTDGYDYGFHHTGAVNPYLMAGTTVNLAPRVERCIYPAMYNSSPYAGGVSQGLYGASGFILGYDEEKALASGTFESAEATRISAKKSYFYFDNEIVCLGSDIYDESGYDVVTTVENRLWEIQWFADGYHTDADVLYVGGEQVTPEIQNNPKSDTCAIPSIDAMTSLDARTMWFGNMGGYVFLGNEEVYYRVVANAPNAKGSETNGSSFKYLEVVINHGVGDKNIENNRYSYVYLPEATVQETEDYYSNPDVMILSRNSTAHAVIEKKLGVIGCVFFERSGKGTTVENLAPEASSVKKITSKDACTVIVGKNADGSYTISVSDPTQLDNELMLDIEITGITEVVSANTRVTAKVENGVARLTVRVDGSLGAAFNVTVK